MPENKITSIEIQKDKSRINLYLDGKFSMGLPVDAIVEFNLSKGKFIDSSTLNSLKSYNDKSKVKQSAINYLSYRQRSVKEIRTHLLSKDFNSDLVEIVIDDLINSGYLDDRKFAEMYVDEKTRLNNLGSVRIKYELRQKGIDEDIIEVSLDKAETDYDGLAEIVIKKYPKDKSKDRQTWFRKVAGFLQRKGYNYDSVKKIVDIIENGEID